MQDNEKKPALRFKGFTDPWEQRKLTNLCEKFTDGDWIEAKDQSDSGVRLVQTGNVGVTEYLDKPNNKKWISFETFEQLHCEEVYPGDILISRLPEPAGRACIMPNLGTKMITAVDCTIVRPNAVTSTRFLLQYLSSQAYFDAVNTCLAGGTRQRISRGNLAEFNVPIPSSKIEQEKIGEVLEKLDTLITLHQRKYEKLVNIKKSMLDKMFPKNGALVPEIRFKGFTDPWEQRKLGEIAVFSKGVGYSKNDLCEEGTPIILYGRLYTKYETCIFDVDTFVKEKAGSVYSKGGEVIVPASGETAEDISIASVVVKPGILLGGDLNIVLPTAEYDSAFLALTISSGSAHKYLSSLAQGKSVVHLHNSDIQSVSAKFPTKREQEKIHSIFGKIDTLITLHQRKLEKLQNIKKSCLEKMFV